MKAEKIITATKDIELDIKGITLLTIEEVKALPADIRKCGDSWWLRSSGVLDSLATFVVGGSGAVDRYGLVVWNLLGVRPALRINLKSTNLQIWDKVTIFGYVWTVISENFILCDNIVGRSQFRKDWYISDANDYETSDIKRWVEWWYADQVALTKNEDKDMKIPTLTDGVKRIIDKTSGNKLLEELEALRINVDAECQDLTGALQDKYERTNEMLDECIDLVKKYFNKSNF